MAINLIDEVQKELGYTTIPKIDPNSSEGLDKNANPGLEQAAVPVVTAIFYARSRNEADAENLLHETSSAESLFGDRWHLAVQKVADFCGVAGEKAKTEMDKIAGAIKQIIQRNVSDVNGKTVNNFFSEQRNEILKHLPPAMHIGDLLNDSSFDDRTNKMEGPASGLAHTIEKIFSSSK